MARFNQAIYNRMVSRLGHKWEIAKTEDTTINGQSVHPHSSEGEGQDT